MRELTIIEIECIVMRVIRKKVFVMTVDGHILAMEIAHGK